MTSPKNLLTAWNLHAKKQYGQNFLSDPSTSEMIVSRAEITKEDTVVEIGPGLGALTVPVAQRAHRVFAIEKDTQLIPLLKAELLTNGIDNTEVLNQDILKFDLEEVYKEVKRPVTIVGNLPYNISSQILIKLVKSRKIVSRAIFMFQKELAERLSAQPGCKEYGRISAVLQYCSEISSVADVKAHLFYPPPKIDSEVIEISFREEPKYPAKDEDYLFDVIKAAFSKRRKTLKNALTRSELQLDTDIAVNALEKAGIDPTRRAETLTIKEFVDLSNNLLTQ